MYECIGEKMKQKIKKNQGKMNRKINTLIYKKKKKKMEKVEKIG